MIRTLALAAAASAVLVRPAAAQETPETAVEALYGVISGPVGQARDWDRFRAMFLDGARMTIVAPTPEGGERIVLWSVEDYIARNSDALAEIGFTETETRGETVVYGGLAVVVSAYEAVRADTGDTIATGVNTITLARDGEAWKVASLAWRPATEHWPVDRAFETFGD